MTTVGDVLVVSCANVVVIVFQALKRLVIIAIVLANFCINERRKQV